MGHNPDQLQPLQLDQCKRVFLALFRAHLKAISAHARRVEAKVDTQGLAMPGRNLPGHTREVQAAHQLFYVIGQSSLDLG
ncbi:hypothetical protein D3C84_986490 [compost metagenome]